MTSHFTTNPLEYMNNRRSQEVNYISSIHSKVVLNPGSPLDVRWDEPVHNLREPVERWHVDRTVTLVHGTHTTPCNRLAFQAMRLRVLLARFAPIDRRRAEGAFNRGW